MTNQEWQHCKCGASWMGYYFEQCNWCLKRRLLDEQQYRQELLNPPWLQQQGPKYWELSDVDRQVWNTTRGIPAREDIQGTWALELQGAVDMGTITPDEHVKALKKWTLMKNSSGGIQRGKMNS